MFSFIVQLIGQEKCGSVRTDAAARAAIQMVTAAV
jgi:hypothetical protein